MRGDGWERSSCCSFSTRGMSSWWVGEWGGSVVWDVEGCVFGCPPTRPGRKEESTHAALKIGFFLYVFAYTKLRGVEWEP